MEDSTAESEIVLRTWRRSAEPSSSIFTSPEALVEAAVEAAVARLNLDLDIGLQLLRLSKFIGLDKPQILVFPWPSISDLIFSNLR